MHVQGRRARSPTRFRLRVLAAQVRQGVHGRQALAGRSARAQRAGDRPSRRRRDPDGDCDGDGVLNRVDTDDDNDLLPDTLEAALRHSTRATPTPTATASRTATSTSRPWTSTTTSTRARTRRPAVPGQAAVPEPARHADANIDYDGDALTLDEEYRPLEVHDRARAARPHASRR